MPKVEIDFFWLGLAIVIAMLVWADNADEQRKHELAMRHCVVADTIARVEAQPDAK